MLQTLRLQVLNSFFVEQFSLPICTRRKTEITKNNLQKYLHILWYTKMYYSIIWNMQLILLIFAMQYRFAKEKQKQTNKQINKNGK